MNERVAEDVECECGDCLCEQFGRLLRQTCGRALWKKRLCDGPRGGNVELQEPSDELEVGLVHKVAQPVELEVVEQESGLDGL